MIISTSRPWLNHMIKNAPIHKPLVKPLIVQRQSCLHGVFSCVFVGGAQNAEVEGTDSPTLAKI